MRKDFLEGEMNHQNMFFRMTGRTAEKRAVSLKEARNLVSSFEVDIILKRIKENGLHVVVHKNSAGRYDFRTDDTKQSPFYREDEVIPTKMADKVKKEDSNSKTPVKNNKKKKKKR